jgi:hypothetical protein
VLQLEILALLLSKCLHEVKTKSRGIVDDIVVQTTIVQQGECEAGISAWTRKQDSVTFDKEGADVEFAVNGLCIIAYNGSVGTSDNASPDPVLGNDIPGAECCQENLVATESIQGEWSAANLERSSDCTREIASSHQLYGAKKRVADQEG